MSLKFKPPKLARKFLYWHCDPDLVEEIEGDLNEEFEEIYKEKGRFKARIFYLFEVVRFLRMYKPKRRIKSLNHLDMLSNNLKIALRTMRKHRAYAFINLLGLMIGITCSFLIFLFVKAELSFDRFHERADNIYRLQHVYGFMNAQIGQAYKAEYPEVEDNVRVYPWLTDSKIVLQDKKEFYDDAFLVDKNFLDVFSFDILQGDAKTALDQPNRVVLTRSIAEKYFPGTEAVGQTFKFQGMNGWLRTPMDVMVSAVIEDTPFNSHLQFDMLLSFQLLEDNPNITIMDSWINDWVANYLVLKDNPDIEKLRTKSYHELWQKHAGRAPLDTLSIMPLDKLHLNSSHLQSDYTENGDINQVRIFAAIAVVILLIACINFMNLATARASKRGKEVGVRKVMGAHKKQLVIQFLTESFLITIISALVSCLLVYAFVPVLENMTGLALSSLFNDWIGVVLPFIAIVFVTSLLAGFYPAFVLSAFQPASILQSAKGGSRKSALLRKSLVVFQFTVSVVLILAAIVAFNQMRYVKNKDLGFEPERVIAMNFGTPQELKEKWSLIKGELIQMPSVKQVFATRMIPGDKGFYWNYRFEGYTDQPMGEGWMGYYLGPGTVEGFGFELIMGKGFEEGISRDSTGWLLNESAWKLAIEKYGEDWENPIGKKIEYYTTNTGDWNMDRVGVVVGVIKDFHHHSLQDPIQPLVIHNSTARRVLVKVSEGELQKTLATLQNKWESFGGKNQFNYQLVDQEFDKYYAKEDQFSQLVLVFCGLAIFVACLGLLGLASFTAEMRIKEIGIRKVLGASVSSILWMLSSNFLRLIILAFVVAAPLGYLMTNSWLNNFSYRINVGWEFFAYAILATGVIAMLTVGYHSTKAATDNPTKSLRYE